jgi:hypothetical protein
MTPEEQKERIRQLSKELNQVEYNLTDEVRSSEMKQMPKNKKLK